MKSNYRPIGNYIQKVENRNRDLKVTRLLGLSMTKEFRETTSNVVGTDMSVYRIISKYQFACDFMSPIRVSKLPVVLKLDDEPNLVSPAYPVFEVKDRNELDPEYLMMWFRRPEFDRYATFKCDAAIRGGYDWEELCETFIPVPHIDKQREIVKEYNTIQNRIALSQQLIQKLEETALAIYWEWFVEFEFPDENRKPYKSNGGEMVWNEELGKEIPLGWEVGSLNDVVEYFISKRGKSKSTMNLQKLDSEFKYPVVSAMNISNGKIVKYDTIPYVNEQDYNEWMNPKLVVDDVLLTSEAPLGETYYIAINSDLALSQRLFALRTKKEKVSGWFLYLWLNTPFAKQELEGRSSGTTVFGIKLSELKKVQILIPNKAVESRFNQHTNTISKLIEIKNQETQKLTELKELLLSKLATAE